MHFFTKKLTPSIPKTLTMKELAIFASGSGTNAENIIKYFNSSNEINIALVLTNNPTAGIIDKCKELGVKCRIFSKTVFRESDDIYNVLIDAKIDYIILAGFLWFVPQSITNRWAGHIINIHPALLPKYGGKGMHGMNVHRAIVEAGESETGITIHHVDDVYDNGGIIFQTKVEVEPNDTPDIVAAKVQVLEQAHFPKVIEKLCKEN